MEGSDDTGAEQRQAAAGKLVRRFSEFWAAPSRERLAAVLGPDVRLSAPLTPTTHGFDDGWKAFETLLGLVPDLSATVHRWGTTGDGVLIEFTLAGTVGGGPISWTAVDRFTLGPDGLATERISYFDSVPIALTIARRPRIWSAFARAQLRR